jgi:hypothetical protein
MEVEEIMSITNYMRGLFAICFLASTCYFCYISSKNVHKKAAFNQYVLLIEWNIYFIKIHVIKTIVITQPFVLWLVNFLIQYLLFSYALKYKDDYPWTRCLIEDRFEEISNNGYLMLNEDYIMDMFSSVASN